MNLTLAPEPIFRVGALGYICHPGQRLSYLRRGRRTSERYAATAFPRCTSLGEKFVVGPRSLGWSSPVLNSDPESKGGARV